MYAVATFIVVAILSIIFTRLATGALIATGVPPEVAAFQARSAFTGAGFTTTEAENVVNHSVRRRIVATTMLVGNLGTPTLIVSVLIGFLAPGPGDTTDRLLGTVIGLSAVAALLGSPPVKRWVVGVGRAYTRRHLIPAVGRSSDVLVDLGDDFAVEQVALVRDPVLPPRSLRELDAALEGIQLLGVQRDGDGYVGAPPADIELHAGDVLVVYGHRDRLRRLVDGASDG